MNQYTFRNLFIMLVLFVGLPGSKTVPAAVSTTFIVTKIADTNDGYCDTDCSLREAIIAANTNPGDDIITLPSGIYTLTIIGVDEDNATTGDLDITDNLTILGEDATTTIINCALYFRDRVFHIIDVFNVSFSNLTISGGYYFLPESPESKGGGILIESSGNLTVVNSTLNNNVAFDGGGIYNDSSTLVIYNSTIYNNWAVNGGGINNANGTLTLINSTVSGNGAEGGGSGIKNSGTVYLNNVTITNNTGTPPYSNGGGVSGENFNIKNTIISGNTADYYPDCSGTLNSQGYNLIQDISGCTINGDTTGNIIGVSPNLGPLQNNGGPTFTHSLLASCPAIDTGNPATPGSGGNTCEANDQRGVSRPRSSYCDIGAYEAEQNTISGQVTDGSSTPIAGVTISATGGYSVVTDSGGNYTLSGLPAGIYTLTPSKTGYSFTPTSRAVTVPPNATGINFTGTLTTYSISGKVTTNSSTPIAGVTILATGGYSATTDSGGNYTLNGLPAGIYTLTPSKTGYSFTPTSRAVTVPPNAIQQDFTGSGDWDGDGLFDSWELFGFDADNDGIIDVDLPAMGANPNHKDIFVEIDYMEDIKCVLGICVTVHSHRPNSDAISMVVEAFKDAPVSNIDGIHGIDLHVDFGPDTPMNSSATWGSLSRSNSLAHDDEINWDEFTVLQNSNFDPERENIFHYSIFAHILEEKICASGSGRLPGWEFTVTLGGWGGLPGDPDFCDSSIGTLTGTTFQQAGTFMHELGHNLGLNHGGGDGINAKPNYLSIMNYPFQTRGLIFNGSRQGTFDYSRSDKIPNLVESNLNEAIGLNGGSSTSNYGTRWTCPNGEINETLLSNDPINWNCNGNSNESGVAANINNGWEQDPSPSGETLSGYFDWNHLVFTGDGSNNNFEDVIEDFYSSLPVELTLSQDETIIDPYDVGIFGPGGAIANPGTSIDYTFTIINSGSNSDTISVNATSSNGWVDLGQFPMTISLDSGELREINIEVMIPGNASGDVLDTLKLTASSQTDPAAWSSIEALTKVRNFMYLPLINQKK